MTVRKYHSPRRVDAATRTREAILSSAYELFMAHGYADVTMGDIAKRASVATATVYSSAGNKPAILTALLLPAITDPLIAEHLAAIEASDDPHEVIKLTVRGTRLTHERHWDLVYGLFYRNPPGEAAVKSVLDRGADDYVQALTRVADHLAKLKALRTGVTAAEALDVLWFFAGPGAWTTLVGQRAWSFERAQEWMTHTAAQALLRENR